MTTKQMHLASPARALARLIVAGVAVLAVALFGSVPASAAAGTSKARAGSYSSGPQTAGRVGEASVVDSVAAAGSRAGSYVRRTYNMGTYPWPACFALGAYYQKYYAARGYYAWFQCPISGGIPPFHTARLLLTLAF
ncbi:hypothetical protein ACIGW7_13070 [Streptomyces sp. NPDC053253]|uniref:hypothetical protein n=1 Tax=Streptomyces sp. NPDC053253 TaxID=3365699 RepID=UPI0037D3A4DA